MTCCTEPGLCMELLCISVLFPFDASVCNEEALLTPVLFILSGHNSKQSVSE